MSTDTNTTLLYSQNVLEFVTVTAETCLFLENASAHERTEFIEKALKILPLLYLKTAMLPETEEVLEELPEQFVTESAYEQIRNSIASLLGTADDYLEVFTQGIEYSEEGVKASVSEDLADVYQDLKNFISAYQIGNEEVMNDALYYCTLSFREYWGQKLLNGLRALHAAFYSPQENDDSNDSAPAQGNKERLLKHLHTEWQDEFIDSLPDDDEF